MVGAGAQGRDAEAEGPEREQREEGQLAGNDPRILVNFWNLHILYIDRQSTRHDTTNNQ